MGLVAYAPQPSRAATWLLGSGRGIQVWTVATQRCPVSVYLSDEPPVILLSDTVAGTPGEGEALDWALNRISLGGHGLYVWRP